MSKFAVKINKLSNSEQNEIGIFLSYTRRSDTELFEHLVNKLTTNGINVLSDSKITLGSEDFSKEIKKMLSMSIASVVILPTDGDFSPWVTYEIALLESSGKDIYLYQKEAINYTLPSYLQKYEPVINEEDQLIEILKSNTIFKNLLSQSTSLLTIEDYNKYIKDYLESITLKFKVPEISKIKADHYQFGCIICGLYKIEFDQPRNKVICGMNGYDLEEAVCYPVWNCNLCPLSNNHYDNRLDRVVLNKLLSANKVSLYDEVEYILPISKKFGLTFKCYVDIFEPTIKDQIIECLTEAGISDISVSSSGHANRLYFCLPKDQLKGLFVVRQIEGFYNNYICPGVV